ncbi:unnamed protein product [Larinioides sclopetarius]|uniref:Mediator of RNA polymerase II transcription subunit 18 n=1 Tax=Larinioides sclopetarius TaxID=280406 RepID=A0AAV1Z6P4_9ARAC
MLMKIQKHSMIMKWYSKYVGPTGTPLILRARQALDHPEMPWHLRYIGQPEIGDKNRATMIRSCIDVDTSNNVVQFLNELGFRLDYEFVLKGFMFRKGRMKVTVAKVCRLLQQNNPDSIEPVSQSYLVELSVVAPTGQEALADEMKAFSEQLKPLVQLDKFDHRRLQHV